METIEFKDINFKALKKGPHQGSNSLILYDDDTCYKIFNKNIDKFENRRICRLFYELEGMNNNKVLLPKYMIMQGNYFVGYTMKRVDAKTISEVYMGKNNYLDCKEFFYLINIITDTLKELHTYGITITDFSFENILVDKDNNIYFGDFDSFSYNSNKGQITSALLVDYITKTKKGFVKYDQNTDRISLLLSFLQVVCYLKPTLITNSYYRYYSRRIKTLSNIKPLHRDVMKIGNELGYIPYIDEYIDTKDEYIIDREKQLKIRDKKCGIYL